MAFIGTLLILLGTSVYVTVTLRAFGRSPVPFSQTVPGMTAAVGLAFNIVGLALVIASQLD